MKWKINAQTLAHAHQIVNAHSKSDFLMNALSARDNYRM